MTKCLGEVVAVVGLGYVGLPLAIELARAYEEVIGFDVNERRIDELVAGVDRTREVDTETLAATRCKFTAAAEEIRRASVVIVAVPTPIDRHRRPDLSALKSASNIVGKHLRAGAVVVFESTVYPGVTEGLCADILMSASGLRRHQFKVGYSPERINPGDREHTLTRVIKVVSGEDELTLERIAALYSRIVEAGVHKAPSIRVAEAAKVIENTQRDLNIALMNELALLFNRLEIRTEDVLAAAGTKWNFLPFRPGLVGGHCIGVDPYYLTAIAEEVGFQPNVILAGRTLNDSMGDFVAQETVRLLATTCKNVGSARVGVLGITFKENVPDIRNSRVLDIVESLRRYGVMSLIHDPQADSEELLAEHGLELTAWEKMIDLDAVIIAVAHREYAAMRADEITSRLRSGAPILDVKSMFAPRSFGDHLHWAL